MTGVNSAPSKGCNKAPDNNKLLNPLGEDDEDDEADFMIDMVSEGPSGLEWGGPRKGGKFPEPTRYGDWEQKGRASDF